MSRILAPMDKLPEGWKRSEGALTAPKGYYWANNGKSLFSPEYRQALITDTEFYD